jgi:hypothetical protein
MKREQTWIGCSEVAMRFDPERVRANARAATTEDLLDRVTVYRSGMEPAALDIIETELGERGVRSDRIEAHARSHGTDVICWPDGTARPCSFCERPAVTQGWGWHRWWGLVPLFPRFFSYCAEHQPQPTEGA